MIAQPDPQRRMYHRIRFPVAEQPRWIVGDASFAVVDLAEASCRLARLSDDVIDWERPLSGILRFADGDQVWIEGQTVRQDSAGIVVQFTKGVTFKKVVALQRELLRKYPARRDPATADNSR